MKAVTQYWKHFAATWGISRWMAFLMVMIMVFRIGLSVSTSGQRGDEAFFAMIANQTLHCAPQFESLTDELPGKYNMLNEMPACGQLPLTGLLGNLGIFYGPYPAYFYILSYGLTGFNFPLMFLLVNLLSFAAVFGLAATIRGEGKQGWIILLGLSSPLAVWSSMILWDTPLLIPLSALVLYIGRPGAKPARWREFVIGLLIGVALASHAQSLPFIAGFIVWRILLIRRQTWSFLLLLFGALLALIPYLLGIYQRILQISPRLRTHGDEAITPDPLAQFVSIYRFFGAHSRQIINSTQPWVSFEQLLAQLSYAIIIVLLVLTAIYFWLNRRKLGILEPMLLCFGISVLVYLPLAWLTNSGLYPQYGMAIWWFTPLALPFVLFGLFPQRAAQIILVLLVAFNLLTVLVEHTPRIQNGTSLQGYGPSWWMQSQVVNTICNAATEARKAGTLPLKVELDGSFDANFDLATTITSMVIITRPECVADLRLSPVDGKGAYVVEAADDGIHLQVRKR